MHSLSRRSFVKHACAATCACGASFSFSAPTASLTPRWRQVPRDAVQITAGPLLTQFNDQQRLYLGLDDDSLLKPFRQRAGQPAPGADMGGWYDVSTDFHVDPKDWSTANWHGFIPGHSFGQYVSALARGYAATRDAATRRKVSALVSKFAAAISPKFFDDYTLPAYTFDKSVVGLVDAFQFADVTEARDALARLTDAALPYLPQKAETGDERRARPYHTEAQLWDEPYTLPENLFLAAGLGMGERYGPMAMRYLQDGPLFDPLAEGRSPFKGKHAYSHVNALSSAARAFLSTGNEKYLKAAGNGFDFVKAQSWATGGWGANETLLAADDTHTLFDRLSNTHNSFETPCGAYAHFKITRTLLQISGDQSYGDSMERVLYNTILGALPTKQNGETFYYADYNQRARKFYRPEPWPCCSGTFAQLAADYGISAYLLDGTAPTLLVNLYVPSRVTVPLNGEKVTITQATDYPAGNTSRFTIDVARPTTFGIELRIPAWAGPETRLKHNGESRPARIWPGSASGLTRQWKRGDVLEIEFDMSPRLEQLNAAHPEMVALLVGPRVLFPVEAPDEPVTRTELLSARPKSPDEWIARTSAGDLRLKPFAAITTENYRLYSQLRSG